MNVGFSIKTLLLGLIICCGLAAWGQRAISDSVQIKTKALLALLTKADTLNSEEMYGDSIDINGTIARLLSSLLQTPAVVHYDLDSLLKNSSLTVAHAPDKRIWFFSWYANNGGTWQINNTMVYYRTKKNEARINIALNGEDDNAIGSCLGGGRIDKVVKLRSTAATDLYLYEASVKGCSTCCGNIFGVLQLTGDSVNYSYPGFSGSSPCFMLPSRCGHVEQFIFDKKSQTILYTYIPDDETPVQEDPVPGKVKGSMHFNGEKFVEPPK